MEEKFEKLKNVFRSYGSALVAFSGGVDSAFVLKVARDVLGRENVKAVTAKSPSLPERELEESRELARLIDAEQLIIETREIEKPGYRENAPDRCYFCKETLYETMAPLAKREGKIIVNGTNADDLGDYRPGLRAAAVFTVRSPLVEAGFTKEDVRHFSRQLGLPTWDKPAMACLSSRVPYGEEVSPEKLRRIELAENFLKDLGFRVVRVRHPGEDARIEVDAGEVARLLEENLRESVNAAFKAFGFRNVTVDLEGYRMGNLNSVLGEAKPLKR